MPLKSRTKVEFGDFQTPPALAEQAVKLLRSRDLNPSLILEPTCGTGSFIEAAAKAFPEASAVVGSDINPEYISAAQRALGPSYPNVRLQVGDFFATDWHSELASYGQPLLILGNPPWVTSATLGALASSNLPEKSNFQKRAGFDAISGKANFDISEWMILKYLEWIGHSNGTIAVLCKSSVARKILAQAWRSSLPVHSAAMFRIDAVREFGAAVDACFFVLDLREGSASRECPVYGNLSEDSSVLLHTLGFDGKQIVSDMATYKRWSHLDLPSEAYVWRSGVKHDCSKVMELVPQAEGYRNGLGEIVQLEDTFLFPVLKSSDVGNGRLTSRGVMLVTQRFVGDDTSKILDAAPKTWAYLQEHQALLGARGSTIYKKNPAFSVFGVGAYTFMPWKVAISGFYKSLSFSLVGEQDGKPVVFDDTINFIGCTTEAEAAFLHALLQSEPAREFLGAIIHWDEKRPITVSILKRLNLRRLSAAVGREEEFDGFARAREFDRAA